MSKNSIRHQKNKRRSFLTDGKLALGMVLGVVSTVLAASYYEFFTGAAVGERIDLLQVSSTAIVGVATLVLALRAFLEQRKAREASTDPVLIPHFGRREDARELITFCISNVGAGPALNVDIKVIRPDDPAENRELVVDIFRPYRCFTVILQDQTIEYNFSLGWNLLGEIPFPLMEVELEYEDLAGENYQGQFVLDVREMEKFGTHRSPIMRAVNALEKIESKIPK